MDKIDGDSIVPLQQLYLEEIAHEIIATWNFYAVSKQAFLKIVHRLC